MSSLDFGREDRINSKLLTPEFVSTEVQNAMYTDEYFGLKNIDNYGKWDQLMV